MLQHKQHKVHKSRKPKKNVRKKKKGKKTMENKAYKQMTKKELWQEIRILVNATQFTIIDKELILNCIKEWGWKNGKRNRRGI